MHPVIRSACVCACLCILSTACGLSQTRSNVRATVTAASFSATQTAAAPRPTATFLPTPKTTTTASPRPSATSSPTPTASATRTPAPSVTLTATATSKPTATSTPTRAVGVVVTANNVNVYEGPSTEYAALARFNQGEQLFVLGQYKECAWLKVESRDRVSGWIPGGSRYVELRLPCNRIPAGTYRPFTGIVRPYQQADGWGELTIENGGSEDAAVVLTLEGKSVCVAYVRAGDEFTVDGIRDGRYEVYFSAGSAWDGAQFTVDASYERFEDAFDFTTTEKEYTVWTVTLFAVEGGEVQTAPVDANDFPNMGE